MHDWLFNLCHVSAFNDIGKWRLLELSSYNCQVASLEDFKPQKISSLTLMEVVIVLHLRCSIFCVSDKQVQVTFVGIYCSCVDDGPQSQKNLSLTLQVAALDRTRPSSAAITDNRLCLKHIAIASHWKGNAQNVWHL